MSDHAGTVATISVSVQTDRTRTAGTVATIVVALEHDYDVAGTAGDLVVDVA